MCEPVASAEQFDRLASDVASLERRHAALQEAHHAAHEGFHGRLDEQRKRMDTLSAAQQSQHEHLLELQARLRQLERQLRGQFAELPQ